MTAAQQATKPRTIRVLIAKPGLDGHDVGAKLVCRALVDAGMEVVYTGLRQSPTAIARAAVEESVDVVGLSVLSGAHVALARKVAEALREVGREDALIMIGGTIPRRDHAALTESGVRAIFPTGTLFEDIVAYLNEAVSR